MERMVQHVVGENLKVLQVKLERVNELTISENQKTFRLSVSEIELVNH